MPSEHAHLRQRHRPGRSPRGGYRLRRAWLRWCDPRGGGESGGAARSFGAQEGLAAHGRGGGPRQQSPPCLGRQRREPARLPANSGPECVAGRKGRPASRHPARLDLRAAAARKRPLLRPLSPEHQCAPRSASASSAGASGSSGPSRRPAPRLPRPAQQQQAASPRPSQGRRARRRPRMDTDGRGGGVRVAGASSARPWPRSRTGPPPPERGAAPRQRDPLHRRRPRETGDAQLLPGPLPTGPCRHARHGPSRRRASPSCALRRRRR